jgi:hypothetical protein
MSGDDPMAKGNRNASDIPLGGKPVPASLSNELIRAVVGERPTRRLYAFHLIAGETQIGVYDGFGAFVLPPGGSPELLARLREAMQGVARRAVVVDLATAKGALMEIDEAFRLVESGNRAGPS